MTKNWLKYWRNSLADGERMERNISKTQHYQFETLDLAKGQLPLEETIDLIDRYERKINRIKGINNPKNEEWITIYQINIVISPLTLLPIYEHAKKVSNHSEIHPFWANALVDRYGTLKIPDNKFPTFIRRVLDPVSTEDQLLSLSSVEKVDKVMGEGTPETEEWQDYWDFITVIFKKITDQEIDNFQFDDIPVRSEYTIAIDDKVNGASDGIIKLYDHLSGTSPTPPLFKTLTNQDGSPLKPLIPTKEWRTQMTGHVGQMGNSFPLSFSQRQSLHHFKQLNDGDILAINGPPGTGKTTLLQSIVANEFVEAALNRRYPKIILACSTNNQAVTNIVDSFSKADSNGYGQLAQRWLPDIHSYALFLTKSDAKPKKETHYVKYRDGKAAEGLPIEIENTKYLDKAKQYYLEQAEIYFGSEHSTIESVVDAIHTQIQTLINSIEQKSKQWKADHDLADNPPRLFDELDQTIRHECFLLATHYWEGKWILETENVISPEDYTWKSTKSSMNLRYHRYAMLTPCFVATFYMAPKFFGHYSPDTKGTPFPGKHLFSFIDLLIVDEAGQVTPEVGAATFSLAKKAIVVGDIKQIDPIWKINQHIDNANLKKLDLIDKKEELEDLNDKGFTASAGSIIRLAQNASYYQASEKEAKGMLLVEHKRCFDEIVSYCNDLAYHGLLKPQRGSIQDQKNGDKTTKNYPVPALAYAHVAGESSSQNGSRINPIEVQSIIHWLLINGDKIYQFYNQEAQNKATEEGKEYKPQKLEAFVAIITPFAAQKFALKKACKDAGFDTRKLTIGTIHALQGAERAIVIFSTVYASNQNTRSFFFDSGVNMLNVAVSRAKDSFMLFGDLAVLNDKANSPSGLLMRHLKEKGVDVSSGLVVDNA